MKNDGQYVLGITLYSKEDYDRLMKNHSKAKGPLNVGGIDFKHLFRGYPPDYPCLVEYYLQTALTGDVVLLYSELLQELIDNGFSIRLYEEGAYKPQIG